MVIVFNGFFARKFLILNQCYRLVLVCGAVSLSGCALSTGMQVGELPPSGRLHSANGLNIQVQPITVDTLPIAPQLSITTDVTSLFQQQTAPLYLLERGDVLSINLWAHPEITPPLTSSTTAVGFVIDPMGNVTFPLIGRIRAQGKSLNQFSEDLQQRLAAYLRHPDAQVNVLAYNGRKVFIDGEVRNSGQYAMTDQPSTLYSLLSKAGGVLASADNNHLVLTRHGQRYPLSLLQLEKMGYSPSQLYLQEGDSVHVHSKETRKVYLMGEAGTPTVLTIPEDGISLANVIGEGRGLNATSANAARVYVIRDQASQGLTHIYHLDLSSIANLALADRFTLQANDMVYVDASGLARWSRVINLLLPSATVVRTAQVIGTGN
jgi:polysaccharide export outer membrane protein